MSDPILTPELFAQACDLGQGHPLPADLTIEITDAGARAVLTGPAGSGKNVLAQAVLQAVPADRRAEVEIVTRRPDQPDPKDWRVFQGRD